ncbi:hypothetical protein [Lacipirellula parvula]|uniref:Uncharacterized protein n=1 Tax=Lacipirellula parvula TaxID=2650471 RepID=A0A5K7XFH2_9BACT|nr:hypothetical protein [Lacipirellula parvula]BBO31729.1 hypothetical protein PLANPX_1341 [Lacipirellula parvula]
MELLGQTIDARPFPATSTWIFGVVAVIMLAAAAATGNVNIGIGAIFPATFAVVEWLHRPRRQLFVVDARGLASLERTEVIPFDSIHELTVNGVAWRPEISPKLAAPIVVHHAGGMFQIAPRLSVPPAQLYNLLLEKMPSADVRECHPLLATFHAENFEKFGAAKVTLIHGRRKFHRTSRWRWLYSGAISMVVAGTAWLLLSNSLGEGVLLEDEREGWEAFGGMMALFGLLFSLIIFAARSTNSKLKKLAPDACMVIAPAGMAMKQGDLKGAMRWEEVRSVEFVAGGSSIGVNVPGAKLLILDVYDRSLDEIAMLIRRNAS